MFSELIPFLDYLPLILEAHIIKIYYVKRNSEVGLLEIYVFKREKPKTRTLQSSICTCTCTYFYLHFFYSYDFIAIILSHWSINVIFHTPPIFYQYSNLTVKTAFFMCLKIMNEWVTSPRKSWSWFIFRLLSTYSIYFFYQFWQSIFVVITVCAQNK